MPSTWIARITSGVLLKGKRGYQSVTVSSLAFYIQEMSSAPQNTAETFVGWTKEKPPSNRYRSNPQVRKEIKLHRVFEDAKLQQRAATLKYFCIRA